MKQDTFLLTVLTFFLGLAGIVLFAGCEVDATMVDDLDIYTAAEEDVYASSGTATIRGEVESFEGNNAVLARRRSDDDAEDGRRANIVVTLSGPVSVVAQTDGDGEFVFAEISPGTYEVAFECDGVAVRYRGRSGQAATLTVSAGEILDMTGIRISGGRVNIGNIRVMRDAHEEEAEEEAEEPHDDEEDGEVDDPVLPLDVSGTWLLTRADSASGPHQEHLVLTHSEYHLTGEILESGATVEGETDGDAVWMRAELIGAEIVAYYFTGVVESPAALRGTWISSDGGEGVWEADKVAD